MVTVIHVSCVFVVTGVKYLQNAEQKSEKNYLVFPIVSYLLACPPMCCNRQVDIKYSVCVLFYNRFMPPVTPSTWKTTRLADRFSPVCPQTVPVTDTGMEALLEMPRGRLAQLRRMKPLLANYSEDCLYLNMYVPREGKNNKKKFHE